MKAIGLTRHGAPEVLHSIDLPTPRPGAGEVLIHVRAAAVNPVDAIIRDGLFTGMDATPEHPIVPGMDVAGVIEDMGPDQPAELGFRVGDDVVGFVVPSGTHGGYSERIVLPALSVARAPAGIDAAHAAAFLSNALTAELTLEHLALPEGATLAVTGSAGAVGGYLVELAAARGLTVIAGAALNDTALVRSLGATHIARHDSFVADVLTLTGGRGADAVADPAILTDAVLPAVRDGGQIAFYLPTDVTPSRGIRPFHSYVMRSNTRHDAIDKLTRMVEQGTLTTRVAIIYPATESGAATAHVRQGRGKLRGRLILEFPQPLTDETR